MDTKIQRIQEELSALAQANNTKVVGVYKSSNVKIEVRCLSCGNTWSDFMANFKKGRWCKTCENKSSEEKLVDMFRELDIEFVLKTTHPSDPTVVYDACFMLGVDAIYVAIDDRTDLMDNTKHEELKRRIYKAEKAGLKVARISTTVLDDKERLKVFIENLMDENPEWIAEPELYTHVLAYEHCELDMNEEHEDMVEEPIKRPEDAKKFKEVYDLDLDSLIQLDNQSYMTHPTPAPAGTMGIMGYARVSTSKQVKEGVSLSVQTSRIYDYAQYQKYHVIGIFYDLGISGKFTTNRPSLQKCRTLIEPGQRLIVYALTRLSRDLLDIIVLERELSSKGCYLVALDFNIDTSTPVGKLLFHVMGSFAMYEREQTSERVRDALTKLSNSGKLRSRPSYGWSSPGPGQEFVPNEIEQEVIRYIMKLKCERPDLTVAGICRILNNPDPNIGRPKFSKGKKSRWFDSSVRRIMVKEKIINEDGTTHERLKKLK